MNKYLIIGLAALVIIALGSITIWKFGESKYDEGYAVANAEHNEAVTKAANKAAKDLENANRKVKKIADAGGLDDLLYDLGIMRANSDR